MKIGFAKFIINININIPYLQKLGSVEHAKQLIEILLVKYKLKYNFWVQLLGKVHHFFPCNFYKRRG